MNAVEIEQAISNLALAPFDAAEFPFAFLAAFGTQDGHEAVIQTLAPTPTPADDHMGSPQNSEFKARQAAFSLRESPVLSQPRFDTRACL